MENMTDEELCDFCKSAIKTLEDEKKEEVMKCVGTFIRNPKIDEINKNLVLINPGSITYTRTYCYLVIANNNLTYKIVQK